MKKILFILLLAALASCAGIDRRGVSTLEPLRSDAQFRYFRFTAGTGVNYAVESASAEATRMDWLRTWLDDNGMADKTYEIVSRQPVQRDQQLFGPVGTIYYEVKVPK
jgi:hypothetical protein